MASSAKPKEKGFQTSLRTLDAATKDILSYTKALASADDLLNQNKHLQQKLDAANVTIQEQQSKLCAEEKTNKDLKKAFDQIAKNWANENTDLHAQIKNASIDSTNAVKKKENELNKHLEAAEQATRQARNDIEKQNLSVKRLETSLEETRLQLRGLQADAGVEEIEGKAILDKFYAIETRLKYLVDDFFGDNIITSELTASKESPPMQLMSTNQVFSLMNHMSYTYPCHLFAQAEIATRLSRDVFIQTYLNAPSGRRTMGEFLTYSRRLRPGQKAILRSLLATAFEADEKRMQSEALETAVADLCKDLKPLCRSEMKHNFKKSLHEFLQFAADAWHSVRSNSRLFYATSAPGAYPQSWRYANKDTLPSRENQASQSSYILTLFPHIHCDEETSPFYCGQLWIGDSDFKSSAIGYREQPSLGPEEPGSGTKRSTGPLSPKSRVGSPPKVLETRKKARNHSKHRSCTGGSEQKENSSRQTKLSSSHLEHDDVERLSVDTIVRP